jgi:hypothetical protein
MGSYTEEYTAQGLLLPWVENDMDAIAHSQYKGDSATAEVKMICDCKIVA